MFCLILCTLKSVWVDLLVFIFFTTRWPTALISKVLIKESGLDWISLELDDNKMLHKRLSISRWSIVLEDFWINIFGRLGFLKDIFKLIHSIIYVSISWTNSRLLESDLWNNIRWFWNGLLGNFSEKFFQLFFVSIF